jgi:hypothetical protein
MKRIHISFQLIFILLVTAVGNAQTAVTSVHGTVFDQSALQTSVANTRSSKSIPDAIRSSSPLRRFPIRSAVQSC